VSPASLLPLLTAWMWLNLAGAGYLFLTAGTGQRFWFLLVSAAASWVSLHLFQTYLARSRR